MRRLLTTLVLAASLTAPVAAQTLPQLFQKAKEQVKFGSWKEALATLQEIDTLSQKPGFEKDRAALASPVAFYRGVCYAALDRPDEARPEFTTYLKANPTTTLDPGTYPAKVLSAFDAARRSTQGPGEQAPKESNTNTIAAAYRAFRLPELGKGKESNDDWAQGPVRFLMTPDERLQFSRLSDSISRAEFIEKFWSSRDPTPESPGNEFREEFEKRVAFADQYFVQGETRGSYTDRGMVFVVLGAPTNAGGRPIQTGEDQSDPAALFVHMPGDAQAARNSGASRSAQIAQVDAATGPGTSAPSTASSWRETWRYDRKDLPSGMPYSYVDFDFITKPGYGEGILQKDPPALNALDRGKAGFGKPRSQ